MINDASSAARALRSIQDESFSGTEEDLDALCDAGLVEVRAWLTPEGLQALRACEEVEILCDLGYLREVKEVSGATRYDVVD